jgi:hypothetical protein
MWHVSFNVLPLLTYFSGPPSISARASALGQAPQTNREEEEEKNH